MSKVTITIDGKRMEVAPDSMIIQAADDAGIPIPRFCYHKKLSVAANCRMCLVDVDKVGKPLPACATPVTDGMVVHTQSAKAHDAQKAMMEFLLINHPLDCPICDQGGQCELQDISMGYGKSVSRYTESKRVVKDKDVGSLISTDMTRCILCTRCVRFGEEIAGMPELGVIGRGEHSEITTFVEQAVTSELSGNVIDVCPVGSLTSKPFRFTARAWELEAAQSIAPHDCVGSNIEMHRRNDEVMRVVPHENEAINETWLSDRDRFGYTGLRSDDRIARPMVKQGGEWREVDWQTALQFVVTRLQAVIDESGANQIGAQISPSATTEEMYLLQKLIRALGSHNIDHRLHQCDFSDQAAAPATPAANISLADIENQHAIFLLGSYLRHEQPMANHRVRKAALNGAKVTALNAIDYEFNYPLASKITTSPEQFVSELKGVAKALLAKQDLAKFPTVNAWLEGLTPTKHQQAMADALLVGEKRLIILGAIAQNHPEASTIRNIADLIGRLANAKLIVMTEGANATGAWLAGAVPHRSAAAITIPKPGLDCVRQWHKPLKAYVLLDVEPTLDCVNSEEVREALAQTDFVVAITPYAGDAKSYANVILPTVPFAETAGTFVNIEGKWQSFHAAVTPFEEARPAWKILRVLGNLFHIDGFEQKTAFEVRDELQVLVAKMSAQGQREWQVPHGESKVSQTTQRIADWPIYRGDNLVRHAQPLQCSGTAKAVAVSMSLSTANDLNVQDAEQVVVSQQSVEVTLPLVIDERIADGCVYIPAGYEDTARLGNAFGQVTVKRG